MWDILQISQNAQCLIHDTELLPNNEMLDLLKAKYFNQIEDENHQYNVWGLYL